MNRLEWVRILPLPLVAALGCEPGPAEPQGRGEQRSGEGLQ